jgi:hypothetical protein
VTGSGISELLLYGQYDPTRRERATDLGHVPFRYDPIDASVEANVTVRLVIRLRPINKIVRKQSLSQRPNAVGYGFLAEGSHSQLVDLSWFELGMTTLLDAPLRDFSNLIYTPRAGSCSRQYGGEGEGDALAGLAIIIRLVDRDRLCGCKE